MNKEIIRLAVPNIVSNISVPLLSAVDTALMGHISILHLGAVGLATMIFNFLYWNFGFLRMGTTGMVAQAYGAKDKNEVVTLLRQGILLSLVLGLLLFITGPFLKEVSANFLLVAEDQRDLVFRYFEIVIWGAPAVFCTYTLMGWFFGNQNSFIPMVVTVVLNVFNISVSYLLVVHFDMGIAGAALGTLMAQYFGFIILAILAGSRVADDWKWEVTGITWGRFFRVNTDLFIRTVALTFSFAFFYRQSSAAGALTLAANVILIQFLSWMSYGIDGFAYAAESLVGKYHGMKSNVGRNKAITYAFRWGLGLAIGMAIFFAVAQYDITSLYTDDAVVQEKVSSYQMMIALLPIIVFASYIWDGIYIGLSASRAMRDTMLICLIFYLGLFTILRDISANAIWISFVLFLMMRGLVQTVFFYLTALRMRYFRV